MSRYVGRRVGAARPRTRPSRRRVAVLGLGILLSVLAWGLLVLVAIDAGERARSGASGAWWLVVVVSVAAVACLFAALSFGARLVALLSAGEDGPHPGPPRVPGGRRAAR